MNVVTAPDNAHDEELIRIVNEYQSMLLRLCTVYLRDAELARDATQETFLKAYRTLSAFHGECSEKTWLCRIAVNTCRDMQRSAWFRRVDRRIVPEDLRQPAAPVQEDDLDMMCDIMNLPPKLREVILLYYWQNMNVSEIAYSLRIAQSTVSHRLKHARKKLHDVLGRRITDD